MADPMQRLVVDGGRRTVTASRAGVQHGVKQGVRQAKTLSQWLYEKLFGRGRELPLQADGVAIALAALLGVMVYLAALGLAASFILGQFASAWESGRRGEFTVEIRPLGLSGGLPTAQAGGETAAATQGLPSLNARVGAALQTLRMTPGIARATPMGETELRDLLTPWLGPDINFQDLPLPVLITVQLAPDAPAGLVAQLGAKMPRAIPGLRVDDHGAWLAELRHFVAMLAVVAYAVIALLAGAGALTVILVTRISLLAHRDVVEILHVIGATDRHIAWQFQTFIARIAAVGSGAGALFALLTVLIAKAFATALSTPLLPEAGLGWWFFLVIILLPGLTTGLATIVARVAVLWWVRKLP